MKTLTITLHDTDNCGSSLQAYALQKFLLQNGIENELIDYVPEYTQNNGKPLKTLIRRLIFYRESKSRKRKFTDFKNTYLNLTKKRYRNFRQLEKEVPRADCYIVGSDQLWNTMYMCGKDPAFYLSFANANKIAYAVSVGRDVITTDNMQMISKYIKDFKWVSMREKGSVTQICNSIGIPIWHTCDPVLLISENTYDEICSKRLIDGDYIVVYLAQNVDTDLLELYVQRLREEFGGIVVFVGSYRNKIRNDYHLSDMSPGEFLSLIRYAKYIVSNSFHATLFSLLYRKQFAVVMPSENSLRIEELLQLVEQTDRIVNNSQCDITEISNDDFETIYRKLALFADYSRKILLEQLQDIEKSI